MWQSIPPVREVLGMISLGNGLPFAVNKQRNIRNPKIREIHMGDDSFRGIYMINRGYLATEHTDPKNKGDD